MTHRKNRDLEEEIARLRETNAALLARLELAEQWGKYVKEANDGLADEHVALRAELASLTERDTLAKAYRLSLQTAAQLREQRQVCADDSVRERTGRRAAESRLAAATELLGEVRSIANDSITFPTMVRRIRVALGRAFIAAQPAQAKDES